MQILPSVPRVYDSQGQIHLLLMSSPARHSLVTIPSVSSATNIMHLGVCPCHNAVTMKHILWHYDASSVLSYLCIAKMLRVECAI